MAAHAALLLALGAAALVPTAGAGAAQRHVVEIRDFTFAPAALTVHRGDSVTWHNADLVAHTVTAQGHFDSRDIEAGARWTHRFDTAGRFDYVCIYHPSMHATVTVE